MATSIPVVAIFNSSADIAEEMRDLLGRAGFVVVSAHVDEVRRARSDVKALMEHDPSVIVYELIPPFQRPWHLVQHLHATPEFQRRTFVHTAIHV
jgi:hypothetical protein